MEFSSPLDSEPSFAVVTQNMGEQDITLNTSNTPEPVLASTAHREKVDRDILGRIQNLSEMAGSYMEVGASDRSKSDGEKSFQFLDFLKHSSQSNSSGSGRSFSPKPSNNAPVASSEESSLSIIDFEAMPDPGSLVHVDSNISLGSWLEDVMPEKCQDQSKRPDSRSPNIHFDNENSADVTTGEKISSAEQSRLASRYLMSESQLVRMEDYSDSTFGTPYRSHGKSLRDVPDNDGTFASQENIPAKDNSNEDFHIGQAEFNFGGDEEDNVENVLDFSGGEFQDVLHLQQEFFGSENFNENVAEILDKEEEIFEEEHKLMMNSADEIGDFTGSGFTTVGESQILDFEPKLSIGEYMAARSGKMGKLGESQVSVERPSFGMKIRTPSPRKPYPLQRSEIAEDTYIRDDQEKAEPNKESLNEYHDNTITEENHSRDMKSMEPQNKFVTPDENDNDETAQDTTLEPSMLSLSEAIMNMSTSVNNEELARAIIEISKKKKQEKMMKAEKKRQSCQEEKIDGQPREKRSSRKESEIGDPRQRRSSKIPQSTQKTSPPKPVRMSYQKKQESASIQNYNHQRKQQSLPLIRSNPEMKQTAPQRTSSPNFSSELPAMKTTLKSKPAPQNGKQKKLPASNKSTKDGSKSPLRSVENVTTFGQQKSKVLPPKTKDCISTESQDPFEQKISSDIILKPSLGHSEMTENVKVGFITPSTEFEKPNNWNPLMQESFMQDTPEHDEVVEKSASEQEELPTFNNGQDSVCFPDEISSKYLLSSTRTDLSLTRGSLSRESIEELHKKLRVRGPRATRAPDTDTKKISSEESAKKPEIEMKNKPTYDKHIEESAAEKKLQKDTTWKTCDDKSRESLQPLSQSSPDWKSCSRYSGEFQQMLPSMSFSEMATIQEHQFDHKDLEEDKIEEEKIPIHKLDVIKEEAETTQNTTLSGQSTASGDSQLTSELIQEQLTNSSQHSLPSHVPMMHHHSQHLYPSHMSHVMYRHPSAMSSAASLPGPYLGDVHYRHVDGQYQLPPEYMTRGAPQVFPHPYGTYPMPSTYVSHPMLHSTTTPMGYPPEQPSMASSAEMGLNHTTTTMYHQHGTNYQHSGIVHAPRAATIDGRFPSMPESYYHQHRPLEAPISAPPELVFPGVRCVNLLSHAKLPLTNKTDRWIQIELNIVSPAIDCCFSLDAKPLVGPHDTKNIEISFSPKKEGRFEALLEVISYPVTSEGSMLQSSRSAPSMVCLKAVAEIASAELKGPDNEHELNFGETLCDSAKYLPLRILNKGSAEIPVCVVLCSKSQDRKCFAISDSSSIEWTEQEKRPQSILRTIVATGERPTTVWVHCKIPPKYCDAAEPPKNISAQVYMEIDNSQKQSLDTNVLDSISVEVTACIAKLHAPKNMQPLTFSCSRENTQTRTLPVKNCGNVSTRVSFSVLDHEDILSVTPLHALLAAGEHVQVSVQFKPGRFTPNKVNSTFLMKIEPNGTKYEVSIVATCSESSSRSMSRQSFSETQTSQMGDMPTLLTNKSHICWGGVAVGRSLQQRVVLRTSPGAQKSLPMRVMIKGEDASCFQILREDDKEREELCSKQEMVMRGGQDKIIKILFGPTRCRMALAKLEIKAPVDQVSSTKFTIPLSGYGGRSEIKIEDLEVIPKEDDSNTDLFAIYVDDNDSRRQTKFTVTNNSSRNAFIKTVLYSDQNCQIPHQDNVASCSPSQFVLPKRSSRTMNLSFQTSSDKRSGYSRNGRDLICCVCLWHGDEIARHLLKSALSKLGPSAVNKSLSESNPLRGTSFDGIFEGEGSNKSEEDLSQVKPQLGDVQVFYTGIKKSIIQVFGPRTNKPLLEMVEPGKKSSAASEGHKPIRDMRTNTTQSHQHYKRTNNQDEDQNESWLLSPDHVVLSAPRLNKHTEPSKIKIINRSGSSLRFDVAWSGHYLTITPHSGQVDPESVLIMLLSANPSLASRRDLLPWVGTVQVSTQDGRGTKQLRVQIRDDVAPLDASVQPATPVPRLPLKAQYSEIPSADSFATPMAASGQSRVSSSSKDTGSNKILLDSCIVDFGQTTMKSSTKSNLEFTNVCPSNIRWLLTSFAPAYVKDIEPTGDLYRSTYAAFVFSHTSGLLEPGAKVRIPVTFNPMSEGNYSQFWDLEHHEAADSAALSLNKVRIQVVGQGIKSMKPVMQSQNMNKTKEGNGIYVSEDQVKFSDVPVNESSVLKIPVKNRSKESHNVKFINVRPPFHITHQRHTIRPMSYACLPVTFKPTAKGEFEGTLVIQTETNFNLSVKLLGRGI
ncbi:uncharacterized protein LOC120347828 [Styela clava]